MTFVAAPPAATGGTSCGNQVGTPGVGTVRLRGQEAAVFRAWRLAPGGLQITFAQAQGFSVPITTVTIPWSALRGVLDPASPIARLFPSP